MGIIAALQKKLPANREFLCEEIKRATDTLSQESSQCIDQLKDILVDQHIQEIERLRVQLQKDASEINISHHKAVEQLSRLQDGVKSDYNELHSAVQENLKKAEEKISVVNEALQKVSQKLDALSERDPDSILEKILSDLRGHRVRSVENQLYLNLTERAAMVESFKRIMDDPVQFESMYRSLITGLDYKSRETVNRILGRVRKILDGNTKSLVLFTQEEQLEFIKLKDRFQSQILKISDSLYAYDGYLLPVNQFDPSVFYSKYGLELVSDLTCIKGKDIVDVGGYVGDTALLFSPLTERNVYVFEASPDNCQIINQTIHLNGLKNIILENKALSNETGTVTFSLGERNSCNSLVERPGYVYPNHIQVEAMTLDAYVQEKGINVGLIKVDIEGGEQLFLQGALETIRRFNPILLISIYHSGDDFFKIKTMIESMDLGYRFQIYKPVNDAIVIETILIAERK